MIFYLGVHEPAWLARTAVPLFVSRRRLVRRKSMPRALGSWALDSGGFTELSMHGGWTVPPSQYAAEVRRFRDEIGGLEWAAPQDWMCELFITRKTGRTVAEHQRLTVENLLELRSLAPDLPFVPVLQGFTMDDYMRCVDAYHAAGVDLAAERVVAVGSVCRRQSTSEILTICRRLAGLGLRLHGFGVKTLGLPGLRSVLASADSTAWSMRARRSAPMPGHAHKSCANCLPFALRWRESLLGLLEMPEQISLGLKEW